MCAFKMRDDPELRRMLEEDIEEIEDLGP